MKRPILAALIAALLCGGAVLAQQGGSLAGVTMRVVYDLAGLDAAIIEIPAAAAN